MECQLSLHIADLLSVTESSNSDRAICVPKLRRFQQRQRRNALARRQFKGFCNSGVVFVSADFHLVGVRFAVVDELGFHVGFSDQSV